MGIQLTKKEFIERARNVHGDRFDYSRVNYKGAKEKIEIGCSTHGVFEQTPAIHLIGKGCPRDSNPWG